MAILAFLILILVSYRRKKPKTEQPLPEVNAYFEHLEAEYEALPSPDVDPQHRHYREVIDEIISKKKSARNWDDLFKFELLLLQMASAEKLSRKAWLIRSRFSTAASAPDYSNYLDSKPPGPSLTPDVIKNPELLREDLKVLLQQLYWIYATRTAWEEKRNWFTKIFFFMYLVLAGFGLGTVLLLIVLNPPAADRWHPVFTLTAVALMGVIGGFVSMLQRLQRVPSGGGWVSNLLEMEHGRNSILYQSLISGAVFATILFMIFAAGLAKGDLFPNVAKSSDCSFLSLLRNASADGVQFSKLLVWSFIAGFAERFVPDFLDRFIAKAQAGEGKKVTGNQHHSGPQQG